MQTDECVSLMTSGPKRPWFRFHLLTAVLMMFVGGAWLGLNMRPPFIETIRREYVSKDLYRHRVVVRGRGWPVPQNRAEFCGKLFPETYLNQYVKGDATIDDEDVVEVKEWRIFAYPKYDAVYDNIFLAALALFSTAVLCEYVIRRREGGKT